MRSDWWSPLIGWATAKDCWYYNLVLRLMLVWESANMPGTAASESDMTFIETDVAVVHSPDADEQEARDGSARWLPSAAGTTFSRPLGAS